jgi:hypothetical protein
MYRYNKAWRIINVIIHIKSVRQSLLLGTNYYSGDPVNLLANILVHILMREPLLQNLQQIQQMDTTGIEGIYYLYSKLQNEPGRAQLLGSFVDRFSVTFTRTYEART